MRKKDQSTKYTIFKISKLWYLFLSIVKGGFTVLISSSIIYGVVYAGTIIPPSGIPSPQFYTLSEIYNFIINNTNPGDEGDHSFTFSDSLEGVGYTLTEIYDALVNKIALIDTNKILIGENYFGKAGTMADNGTFVLTASSSNQSVTEGYYSGGTLAGDTDLSSGNIKNNVTIFGVTGTMLATPTYGDNIASKVLNTAVNPGTYDPNTCSTDYSTVNLSIDTVKNGTIFGDSLIGEYPSIDYPLFGGTGNDADISNILFGKEAWTKAGSLLTGTYDVSNLSNDVIKKGITWGDNLGSEGLFYGDTDESKVLNTADGGGIAKGTYNALNLSSVTVKRGTAFGVSETGAYSGYPGSGANRADLTQATCEAAGANNWYWFEDANGDGDSNDSEDGICVLAKFESSTSWNGYNLANGPDNTYIADYTCNGVSFPNGSVATYTGIAASGNPDTTWDQGDCALCQADCYDGVKDLPGNGGYKSAIGSGSATTDYNGPLTPKVLAEWKGTRIPTSNDFFGFCGYKNGRPSPYNSPYDYENTTSADSSNTTYGSYGIQVGRTDEFLDLANASYEWFSEQHLVTHVRHSGALACSYFNTTQIYTDYSFRVVFRP